MVQMGAHKSTFSDISRVELGDSISTRAGSSLQVLHRLLSVRVILYGTDVSRTDAYALPVRRIADIRLQT